MMMKRFFSDCLLPAVYCLLLTTFCLLPAFLFSQHNNFQTYSIEQGLPNSSVYSILQDKRGYLWIGTDGGGLCRFDGTNFKTFGKKENFHGLSVRSLLQDKAGRIWAGTKDAGINIYDGLKVIHVGKKDGLMGSTVLCMLEDNDGAVWVGTDDGGLCKITQSGNSFAVEVIDESKGLSSNAVFNMHFTKDGRLWLATFAGVNVISFTSGSLHIDHLRGGKEIPSDLVSSVCEDNNGTLWFGTLDEGVFFIEQTEKNVRQSKVAVINNKNGFNTKKIWNISKTSNGELWFASLDNGIIRGRLKNDPKNNFASGYIFENYTAGDGFPSDQALCMIEDDKKTVWIGTGGNGICKFMGDAFSHYAEKDGLPRNVVMGIDEDAHENFWLATPGGLSIANFRSTRPQIKNFSQAGQLTAIFVSKVGNNENIWAAVLDGGIIKFNGSSFQNYTSKDGLLDNSVYSILVDKNGIVWCGTREGISRYDGVKFLNISMESLKLNGKGVYAIIQDKKENLWFGTEGGLAKYGGNGSATTYDEAEGLMHKEINSLAEDKDGCIWIGTRTGGIYKFNAESNEKIKIYFIAGDSLLGSSAIKSLVFSAENILFAGTDKGFSKIEFDKNEKIISVRNYDAADGFIGIDCNDNSIFRDRSNNIWIGTGKCLTRFNPSDEIKDTSPPKIYITGIKLFFKEIDWSQRKDSLQPWLDLPASLSLDHSENHLTFDFTAISLRNAKKIKYRYMLQGADATWSPERAESSVTFSGLAPGTYTFKVMAAGANGVWNTEPASYRFVIHPPWYRTILFYSICLALLVGGIYSFMKYRERALVREKNILEDKVTQRTAEVVKQKEHIEEQKKEITDSINYAKRIQRSILPPIEEIKHALPGSFILFKPKDIVSGDFYWFHNSLFSNGPTLLAAADCTGHGVPGAFMSTIGSEKLNEAVTHSEDPGIILQTVNVLMKKVLRQGKEDSTRDGMDIALCSFSRDMTMLEYAGANRPLWIVKNGSSEIEEIKATKNAIGGFTDDQQQFAKHIVKLKKGDTVYVFSDGYADQFGSNDKKLMTKKFKEIILFVQDRSMEEQRSYLDTAIEQWRGGMEQTDDILVIGVRVL